MQLRRADTRAKRCTMKFNLPSVPVEVWPFHATSFRRFASAAAIAGVATSVRATKLSAASVGRSDDGIQLNFAAKLSNSVASPHHFGKRRVKLSFIV